MNKAGGNNVVSLADFKKSKVQAVSGSEYEKYLVLLSHTDLINETKHLLDQIHCGSLNQEILSRIDFVMGEIFNRVHESSSQMASSLNELQRSLKSSVAILGKMP